MTHGVGEAMQLVGLEGQQPFVVVQGESRGGGARHIRVFTTHAAVFSQHPGAALVFHAIPVVAAHEGVDTCPGPGCDTRETGGCVAAVELGWAMHPYTRPHGIQALAQLGTPERVICGLQWARILGQSPQHQVCVSAESTDVIPAPDRHAGLQHRFLSGFGVWAG